MTKDDMGDMGDQVSFENAQMNTAGKGKFEETCMMILPVRSLLL
jgi:hypothetical protein